MGRGCERGGDQMRRRRRGVGETRKCDGEWIRMAPRGPGAVAVRIFTGFSTSDQKERKQHRKVDPQVVYPGCQYLVNLMPFYSLKMWWKAKSLVPAVLRE